MFFAKSKTPAKKKLPPPSAPRSDSFEWEEPPARSAGSSFIPEQARQPSANSAPDAEAAASNAQSEEEGKERADSSSRRPSLGTPSERPESSARRRPSLNTPPDALVVPTRERSQGSFNNVWVKDGRRQSWSDAGGAARLSWAEEQERLLNTGEETDETSPRGQRNHADSAAVDDEDGDVTAWRRGAGSGDEDEDADEGPLDERVAGAFEQLNEAIASNNEVEAAFNAAQRDLAAQKTAHASELDDLQKRCKRQLRRLASFERAKRDARSAADELERASAQLAEAVENEEVAREGVAELREARKAEGAARDDAVWNETEGRLQRRHAQLLADVKKHRADQRYYASLVEKCTRGVLRRAAALGDVANGAMPFLAAERELAEVEREQEAALLDKQQRAQQAKADVKQAMSELERISLEIATAKAAGRDAAPSEDGGANK